MATAFRAKRAVFLLRKVFLTGCVLAIAAAICGAQQTPANTQAPAAATTPAAVAAAAPADPASGVVPALERKIEVMIRAELAVPPQYEIAIGPRQKSDVNGYDTIAVTFLLPSQPNRKQTVDFLLSKDSSTLARLSKWDIGPDPAGMLPTSGRPMRGDPDAKVMIVNFDDLECPYCAQMNAEFFPATLDRYKGLVKFVYMDYPLVEIHPWAMHAAVNANCPFLGIDDPDEGHARVEPRIGQHIPGGVHGAAGRVGIGAHRVECLADRRPLRHVDVGGGHAHADERARGPSLPRSARGSRGIAEDRRAPRAPAWPIDLAALAETEWPRDSCPLRHCERRSGRSGHGARRSMPWECSEFTSNVCAGDHCASKPPGWTSTGCAGAY